MNLYKIKILNEKGEIVEISKHYHSDQELEKDLTGNGCIIVEYKRSQSTGTLFNNIVSGLKGLLRSKKITDEDVYNVFYEAGVMLRSGVPILDSFQMIREGINKSTLQKFLDHCIQGLKEGQNLSSLLREQGDQYDFRSIIPVVQMGERSGSLGTCFLEISSNIERWIKTRSEITNALVYPVVLLFTSVFAIYIILVYVIPKFSEIVENFKVVLPFYTRALFSVSVFFSAHRDLIILSLIIIFLTLFILMRRPGFKRFLNNLSYRIPVIRSVRMSSESIKFLNSLSNLLSGGVPVISSLDLSSENFGSDRIRDKLKNVSSEVQKGDSLAYALKNADIFPDLIINMIKVGENSGQLPKVLKEVTDYLSEKFLKRIKRYMNLLEPMIIVFVAIFVGFIIVTILPVIMNLSDINF